MFNPESTLVGLTFRRTKKPKKLALFQKLAQFLFRFLFLFPPFSLFPLINLELVYDEGLLLPCYYSKVGESCLLNKGSVMLSDSSKITHWINSKIRARIQTKSGSSLITEATCAVKGVLASGAEQLC